jgi:hypothetical protein
LRHDIPKGRIVGEFFLIVFGVLAAPLDDLQADRQSTGNIRLLQNMDLRLALASYYSRSATLNVARPAGYRAIVRGIIPFRTQKAIREHCPTTDPSDAIPTGFPACSIPDVGSEEASRIFAQLAAHPGIEEILTYRVSEIDVSVRLYNMQEATAQGVIDLLDPR